MGAFDPGRGDVGGIADMFGRGQAGVGEVVMDLPGEFAVLDWGDRSGHVDDHLVPAAVKGLGVHAGGRFEHGRLVERHRTPAA
ncbi:hypothetical protein [Streptomyces sp. MK37H]|uniref:hypothetical protein n=1 Tax=Streptomyces sp. MK37H TaxID=2699117 RepID=UPI001B36EF06|nr:hypothetical protein [Streptomyces sp. MK37H]MBP8536666.1 hypothetical protein [Streptomyces sp. MK37H]